MDTLRQELDRLVAEVKPTLIDDAQWQRIIAEEEREIPGEDCVAHDGCRSVIDGWMPGRG